MPINKNNMIRYVIIALLLWAALPAQAQERVEALRVAFITDRLALTPTEAQAFWPIYNEFKEKTDNIERPFPDKKAKLTDKEADDFIEKGLAAEEARIKLKREYYKKLKKVIPPQKLLELHRVEKDFKRELIGTMRHERRKGGNGHERANKDND
jgi:hypothetical protein